MLWFIPRAGMVQKDRVLSMRPAVHNTIHDLAREKVKNKCKGAWEQGGYKMAPTWASHKPDINSEESWDLVQGPNGRAWQMCSCWSVYSFIQHLFYWVPNMNQTYLLATGNTRVTKTDMSPPLRNLYTMRRREVGGWECAINKNIKV